MKILESKKSVFFGYTIPICIVKLHLLKFTHTLVKIFLNLTILQLIYTCFIKIHSQVKEG